MDDDDDDDSYNNNNMYAAAARRCVSSGITSLWPVFRVLAYTHGRPNKGGSAAAARRPQGLWKRLDRLYMHKGWGKRIAGQLQTAEKGLRRRSRIGTLDYSGPTTRVRGTHDAKSRNQ